MRKGDVLILRDKAIMLCEDSRLGQTTLCNKCAIRHTVLCGNDGSHTCDVHGYFTHIEPTEEIESARDLFALKGELM